MISIETVLWILGDVGFDYFILAFVALPATIVAKM